MTDWFDGRATDIANLSTGARTAMTAWLALVVTIASLVYARRQFQSPKRADADNYVDIVPLGLPAEIPYLARSQEWRTVWDSAQVTRRGNPAFGFRNIVS